MLKLFLDSHFIADLIICSKAFLLKLIFNFLRIVDGSLTAEEISPGLFLQNIFSILIFASYFLRAIPPFKQIWWFVKWLLVMMLVKLSINYLKKEVKEWWEKK